MLRLPRISGRTTHEQRQTLCWPDYPSPTIETILWAQRGKIRLLPRHDRSYYKFQWNHHSIFTHVSTPKGKKHLTEFTAVAYCYIASRKSIVPESVFPNFQSECVPLHRLGKTRMPAAKWCLFDKSLDLHKHLVRRTCMHARFQLNTKTADLTH